MQVTLVIIAIIAGIIFGWYAIGVIFRARLDRRLRRSFHGQGILALTYDDGPGPDTTPGLLDLLAKHGAKATFFLIGRSTEATPGVVARIADDGHTIAWHSRTHRNQWKTGPIHGLFDLQPIPGLTDGPDRRISLFRPPYGKMTLGTVLAGVLWGWRVVTWTHVSGDTFDTLPDIDDVVNRVDHDGGGVVLMHDMDREDPVRASFVLDTTAALIGLARRRGWRIVHSPEDWSRLS